MHICLGELFIPEAYITATRQYVAQINSWSLEELYLQVEISDGGRVNLDSCSFGISGKCHVVEVRVGSRDHG